MKNKFLALDNKVEIVNKKLNDNGYLIITCIFARTGIQERYGIEIGEEYIQDKLYKEYRSPDEVFKPSVIDAFSKVVITNDHPQEILTTKNTKYHAVGFVSSKVSIVDNSYLQCEITIYDETAIVDIQNGKVELSAGYLYSITMVENPEYDYIQTDIKPNHIALVQAGRCGDACSLAFDNSKPNLKKGENMKIVFKVKQPDGTDKVISEIEVTDENATAVQEVATKIYEMSASVCNAPAKDEEVESLKDEVAKKDEEIEEQKKANDELQAKLDTQKPIALDDAKVQALAMDMMQVMNVAQKSGVVCKGLDNEAIKKAVIKKHNPDLALDGKSSEYIAYAFDNIAVQLDKADSTYQMALDMTTTVKKDETKDEDTKSAFDKKYGGMN